MFADFVKSVIPGVNTEPDDDEDEANDGSGTFTKNELRFYPLIVIVLLHALYALYKEVGP